MGRMWTNNGAKKMKQYPRETLMKLLMIIMKDENDHTFFLIQVGDSTAKLINTWIQNFFLLSF